MTLLVDSEAPDSAAALTADQQVAVAAFAAWLAAPADGTPFVLSGYAGTGKTFLSMRFLAQGLGWFTAVG